ncbi:MAG: hypothetical protein ACR2OH_08715 [Microthrixaceae bacterium]
MSQTPDYRLLAESAQRRALVVGTLLAVAAAVLLAVLVHIVIGVVVLILFAAVWGLWVQRAFAGAEEEVLASLGEPVPEGDLPGLRNALEGVSLLTGVAEPSIRLIDVERANAMATASADGATVVVTSGLIAQGSAVEAEVLAAELLCRIRDGSARYGTLLAGLPPIMRMASGISEASFAELLGEQSALRGDFDAVTVTRYPPGLIATFERMQDTGTELPEAPPATAALWIAPAVNPGRGVDESIDRVANQPIEYRIAALREL